MLDISAVLIHGGIGILKPLEISGFNYEKMIHINNK
jgi:hypothetical protein